MIKEIFQKWTSAQAKAPKIPDCLEYAGKKKLNILVSGSSGLIGRALIAYLTEGGHSVKKLVRARSVSGETSLFWDPPGGFIDQGPLEHLDAVIHLAGEPVASGRWSESKKRRIRGSRTEGTRLLSETLAHLKTPPGVMIAASAVGYYGDRGDQLLNEDSPPGSGFLAEVCRDWETAAAPAGNTGIRVVNLRFGTVLSPAGGALAAMLPAFKAGLGGKLGAGNQYMSWISIDDALRAILHCLYSNELNGPVNAAAPRPVQNKEFTRTLARVLGRPAFCHLPAVVLKAIFGRMAEELLLSSTRVEPALLLQSGFSFLHPELENALRHLLGKKIR